MTPMTVERFAAGREAAPADVLALAQEHGVRMVDFKFTDLPGSWQHLGLAVHALDEEAFTEGLGFDGSSIRGFQEIAESDMVLLPDARSAVIDPFHEETTLSIICNVIDPITRARYSRDPRYVAEKAEHYLVETGIADTVYMGPEAEFYIFDHAAFDQRANTAFYEVESDQAYWNRGRGFGNGSGMHVHQSLANGGDNLMYDFQGYGQLSREALNYAGGILRHGKALMAFCAPTTNSYRRLVPGYEAPVNLVYSQRNRSAAVRIPVYSAAPKAKRIEFRPPDPAANPYLAFSAMMMAGLDGIQNRIDPGHPVDEDLFELPEDELAKIKHVPGSLDEALDALEEDHEFLLKGGVFTQDLIDTWIDYKRTEEADQVRLRPHP